MDGGEQVVGKHAGLGGGGPEGAGEHQLAARAGEDATPVGHVEGVGIRR